MAPNAAHQRRADAVNTEHIYPDRAFAACACYARATPQKGAKTLPSVDEAARKGLFRYPPAAISLDIGERVPRATIDGRDAASTRNGADGVLSIAITKPVRTMPTIRQPTAELRRPNVYAQFVVLWWRREK